MGVRRRPEIRFFCLALALGLELQARASAADPSAALRGVVRDAFGQTLAGVEVLILPDRSPDALAAAITAEDGRFRISEIPAGLYRVAALKPGYLASVTRANTFLRSTVDVVLHPVPGPGETGSEGVLARPAWMLRAPTRSILRETGMTEIARQPVPPRDSDRDGPASARPRTFSNDGVDGEFRQLVALGNPPPRGGSQGGPILGGETSMQLTTSLGQRGNVRLEGRRESLAASRAETDGAALGSRSAELLAFDISYDTSRDSSLDVSAYFAQGDVRLGSVPDPRFDSSREAKRAWGYDATWTTQLDPASRLAVSLGFQDSSLEVPRAYFWGFDHGAAEGPGSLSQRSIGAAGSYEVVAGDNHVVRVGARARARDLAIPLSPDGGAPMFVDLPGGAGWSLRMDAEDAWSLSGPWTIVYGLGIEQMIEGPDATLLLTRTGVIWTPGPVNLEMMLSYSSLAEWSDRDPEFEPRPIGAGPLRAARPLGWETELAIPIGRGLALRAAHRFDPVRDASRTAFSGEPVVDDAVPIVGSRAADRRNSLALKRESGRTSSSVSWSWGRSEGLIGQPAAFELPVQILAERSISYRSGRLDLNIPASGTDLAIEYGRFQELSSPAGGEPYVDGYVELVLGQKVARMMRLGATCRVLLAARLVPTGERGQEGPAHLERARMIAALNQQVSAGLLVTF